MENTDFPAIKAENLSRSFDGQTAVDSLSLEVRPGEIFGLVGPDGAGKSTTLRMLSGILDPDSGDAWIKGFSIRDNPEKVRSRTAYMSQRFGLYEDLTVQENVEFYANLYGVPKSEFYGKIDGLLRFSYMHPFKNRLAGKLSGGMKQKLQLVCALIHTPEVLLLDEPTNGVDPVSRRDFWRILYQLLGKGVAILVTTAYLDEAERCSRVGLMDNGRLMATGTPDEIRGLMNGSILCVRSTESRTVNTLLRKKFGKSSVNIFGDNVHLYTDTPDETGRMVLEYLGEEGISGPLVDRQEPTLEDVFVSVMEPQEESPEMIAGWSSRETVASGIGLETGFPAVAVKNLTRQFGSFTAVDKITFEVPRGEIFGFLGPNGAGKSTTIKMLCGLLEPTSGNGMVAGLDIRKKPERIKRNIGYMSQKFSLYGDLTVEENIRFYGGIYGLSGKFLRSRMDWAIAAAGLGTHRKSLTSILSGGWRQKLALACSILHEPSIIFLDEPTSGADPLSRRRFWDIIYEMADRHVTVFVTTHYMEEAEYCNRLALIYRGRMIALGTPLELKSGIMNDVILGIKCHRPQDMMDRLSALPEITDIALFGAGLHAVATDADSAIRAVSREFQSAGAGPFNVERIVPGMEDVFVSLIEKENREYPEINGVEDA